MPFVKRGAGTPRRRAMSRPAIGRADRRAAQPRCRDPVAGRAGARPAAPRRSRRSRRRSPARPVPRVREAIMTALMRIGDEASVRALLPYLRSEDAGQRAAAIEALQALPDAIAPFMTALLADGDSDVRILATELARNMPAAHATALLCRPDRARAASQCLRRRDRCAGRGRHPRCCSGAAALRANVLPGRRSCRSRSRSRSLGFRARKARPDGTSAGDRTASGPS